jgi:hypothetical protein
MCTTIPPELGKHLLSSNTSIGTLDKVKFLSFVTALSSTDADIEVRLPENRGTLHETQVSLTQRVAVHDEAAMRTDKLGSALEKKRPKTGSEELTKTRDCATSVSTGDG